MDIGPRFALPLGMSNIGHQVHGRFKMFAGKLEPGHSIAAIAAQVEQFAATAGAAPKSIGVEYLEHNATVVVTLGYRDDEPAYPIKLHVVSLGKASSLDTADLHRLEQRMEQAAAKLNNVICHELFITEDDEFLMVMMVHQSA